MRTRKPKVTNQMVAQSLILSGKDHTVNDIHIETTYFGLRKESGTANGKVSFPQSRIQKVRELLRKVHINTTTTLTLSEMKDIVRDKVRETYNKAVQLGIITRVGEPTILFNINGMTAGSCQYKTDIYKCGFRFNNVLMAENFDNYLKRTVVHGLYITLTTSLVMVMVLIMEQDGRDS